MISVHHTLGRAVTYYARFSRQSRARFGRRTERRTSWAASRWRWGWAVPPPTSRRYHARALYVTPHLKSRIRCFWRCLPSVGVCLFPGWAFRRGWRWRDGNPHTVAVLIKVALAAATQESHHVLVSYVACPVSPVSLLFAVYPSSICLLLAQSPLPAMVDPDPPRIEIDESNKPPHRGGSSDHMNKPLDRPSAVSEKPGHVADEEDARATPDRDLIGSRKQVRRSRPTVGKCPNAQFG